MSCHHTNIANFDHRKGDTITYTEMINRVCLSCKQHWYGPEGDVKEFTREEWDAWMNSESEE